MKGEPSFRLFSKQHYESTRNSCFELDQDTLDFLLIKQIMATSDSEEGAAKQDRSGHKGFYHLSKKVCTTDLNIHRFVELPSCLFLHGISATRYMSLKHHFEKNGLSPR